MIYTLIFRENWDRYFSKMDRMTQERIWKKIMQLKNEGSYRGLRYGVNLCVVEVGQHRICFSVDEKQKTKKIYFIGDHKEYEKWYMSF
ncbi:Uncharacterised protein [Candidatus Gugararchaeum adminiculabundum]|nr:Uncharacterised protein [Candidatus Gugararchaeum adminiculabundum]